MSNQAHQIEDPDRLDEHGSRIMIEIDGVSVAVLNVNGEYHTIPTVCPHVGGPLGEGALAGQATIDESGEIGYDDTEKVIECPWHTRRFDVTTGENADASCFQIPTFDTWEENGEIYVAL